MFRQGDLPEGTNAGNTVGKRDPSEILTAIKSSGTDLLQALRQFDRKNPLAIPECVERMYNMFHILFEKVAVFIFFRGIL